MLLNCLFGVNLTELLTLPPLVAPAFFLMTW
jgi:hypothetical protein